MITGSESIDLGSCAALLHPSMWEAHLSLIDCLDASYEGSIHSDLNSSISMGTSCQEKMAARFLLDQVWLGQSLLKALGGSSISTIVVALVVVASHTLSTISSPYIDSE